MSDRNGRASSLAIDGESLLAELLAEATDRLNAGEHVDIDAYAARHPTRGNEARELLAALAWINPSAPPSDHVIDGESANGVPQALGDFRIIREVGRGGMGVVYEAEQLSLNRRVALKVLPFAATMDPRHLQRFRNESRAAAGLHHPNIVPVYGVGCERSVHFYAMQYIDGRPLSELIRARRGKQPFAERKETMSRFAPRKEEFAFAETADFVPSVEDNAPTAPHAAISTEASLKGAAFYRRVAELGIQTAEALEYAHSMGVVHRDIKPGNLLLDANGKLWVADFGLAKMEAAEGVTVSGDLLGTLRYMSPEQADAKHDLVDHRADIYSLGVTLYELLTLAPAFDGTSRQAILSKVTGSDPVAPRKMERSVPRDLETVVLKTMEKDPSRRYQSARELADDLRRVLGNEPVKARRASLLERAARWSRRHRSLVWSGVALLAVTATFASVAAVVVSRQKDVADRALREKTDALTDKQMALAAESAALEAEQAARNTADANFQRADANLRAALGAIRTVIGSQDALIKVGEPDQVFDLSRTVVAVLEAAVAAYPDQLEYREMLWDAYQSLAMCCEYRGACGWAYREAAQTYMKCAGLLDRTAIDFAGKPTLLKTRMPCNEERDIVMALYLGNASELLLRVGRHADAEIACRRVIELSEHCERREPGLAYLAVFDRARVRIRLGQIRAEEGRIQEARTEYASGLDLMARLKPDDPLIKLYSLALARGWSGLAGLHATRDEDAAREAYRQAARHAEKSPNHHLAEFLADCPDPMFRQPRRALELARKEHSERPKDSSARRVLALALARNGEWNGLNELLPLGKPGFQIPDLDPVEMFAAVLALHHTGKPAEARGWYLTFVRERTEYNRKNEQIARFQTETAEVLGVIAPPSQAAK